MASEQQLEAIAKRVPAGTLKGRDEIWLAVGAVINARKMKKHCIAKIRDTSLFYWKNIGSGVGRDLRDLHLVG